MVLCDTNIFISAFNGRVDTIDQLSKIGLADIVLSSITTICISDAPASLNTVAFSMQRPRPALLPILL
jgi:predicted nucleic acid-binding protein